MKFKDTSIKDCFEISPEVFYDHRGEYVNTFNKEEYRLAFGVEFVEDDISVSRKNVLRGLHGDDKTWKLIQCLHGSIILVVVDCRNSEYTHEKFYLNEKNRKQVLIPPNCANGHYVLSDTAIFSYKQSEYYTDGKNQFTIAYDNPTLGIFWGQKDFKPIISKRDMESFYGG